MPRKCSVPLCKSIRGPPKFRNLSFHKLPKDPLRLREWLMKCQIQDLENPSSYAICSLHFVKSDFAVNMPSVPKKLKPHAIPSRKLPPDLYYMKNQDAEPIVIDVDPMPFVENFGHEDVNHLINPSVYQHMFKDETISSVQEVPTEFQYLVKEVNSPLNDPRAYQHMILEDEIINSAQIKSRTKQQMTLKDEMISSHSSSVSQSKLFKVPTEQKKNIIIKICKFVKPLHIAKKPPENDIQSNDKTELIKPVRMPLAVMNDLVSVIHYDHSYALPFSEDLVHKTSVSVNYPLNENGQFDQSLLRNDVGTMTDAFSTKSDEFEKEIKWLWQRNHKLTQRVSLLTTRNRQLVFQNLKTQRELLRKLEKHKKLKKQVIQLKEKHPELNIVIE